MKKNRDVHGTPGKISSDRLTRKGMMRRLVAPLLVSFTAALLVPYAVAGCVGGDVEQHNGELLRAKAHSLISAITSGPDAALGAAVYVEAPKFCMEYGEVAGMTEQGGHELLTTNHPVVVSSVTKPFVAAAILRLWESGKIELDQSIGSYITPTQVKILTDGGYDVNAITVRQLLSHTAGLLDVFDTRAYAEIEQRLMSGELKHRFTVDEQLKMAMEGGPRFAPGERFEYSDTGYILLGAILEKATGQSMAEATRKLVDFKRLGLVDTWWEVLETKPEGVLPRAHQYRYSLYTDPKASKANGWDIYDTTPFDLFGGGGMVSTTKDLSKFFYALFNGQVFKKAETINLMTSVFNTATPRDPGAELYGHGVRIMKVGDITVYVHGGAWGAYVAYAPTLNMSVSVIGLKKDSLDKYRAATLELISEAAKLR